MLINYFRIAFRNLVKNKLHTGINITGLALGMAGAILLLLNIEYGFSIDQFHEKKANLYEAYNKGEKNNQIDCWNATAAPLAPALKDYPEIRNVARTLPSNKLLKFADKKIPADGDFTDPAFLSMFSFPLVQGDPQTALKDPNDIVITRELATRLFGSQDPINKIITSPTGDNFIVTGVLKDLPANTQFKFSYLLPWTYLHDNGSWSNQNLNTFVELMPGARIDAVNQKIAHVAARKDPNGDPSWTKQSTFLYPLSKAYLENRFENGRPAGGNISNFKMLGGLAAIILLIACINFMNLSTARSEKRAKEVGIRKVVGAARHSLIYQFIGESTLMALLAGIIALLLVQLALPSFSALISAKLSIPWQSLSFWFAALAFVGLTGILAGSYPAFYLSSFRPVKVLKGVLKNGNALVTPRKVLVVLQFVFSIFLINFTVIYQRQVRHGLDRETGFLKDNLVFHPLTDDLRRNYTAVKNELINSGTASAVCESNTTVTRVTGGESGLKWAGMDPNANPEFALFFENGDFIRTNGLRLLAGRDIDIDKYPGDTLSCVINETSARALGFKEPVGQIIMDEAERWKIVGVIKDFLVGMPNQAAAPVLIKGGFAPGYISMRLSGSRSSSLQNIQQAEAILKKNNPNYLTDLQFADEDYANKFRQAKNTAWLIYSFTVIAIFISCMGLLGLSTYMAENRTREIGIRKVLGASVTSIASLMTREFVRLIIISIAIATPLAWLFANSFLRQFSYRTTVNGWSFAATGAAALLIALGTISFQVIRASMTNPVKNLRTE